MELPKQRRKRGVILSLPGFHKLQEARHQAEILENDAARFTLEELSYRTQLAPFTVSKILAREEGVDKQSLEYFFRAFALDLTPSDYVRAGKAGRTGEQESREAGEQGSTEAGENVSNFSLPTPNSSLPTPNISLPTPNSSLPTPNISLPTPNISLPTPNSSLPTPNSPLPTPHSSLHTDWGEAVDVSIFFGRTDEVSKLEYWIINDHCRLVALLGMGGIGKTSLSVKLAQQIQQQFEFVVWRSLRNSPPLEELLANLLQCFAKGQPIKLSQNIGDLIGQFMAHLRSHRCLLILDNAESILASGEQSGHYQIGYEGYGQLLKHIGETTHTSCVVLTSREKPPEIAALEGENLPVRSWHLAGLNAIAALELVRTKSFFCGCDTDWQNLIQHYAGNPLALKIIATTIQELFDGNIAEFFAHGSTVFGTIYDLLNQQFHRLSALEKDLMYWLAINREPVNLAELRADLVLPVSSMKLLEALDSLSRRSLIEKKSIPQASVHFTLQPVVMEYVTDQLIQQVCTEIIGNIERNSIFNSHALIKATAKDYIRIAQTKLILQPIIEHLLQKLPTKQAIEIQLRQILQVLQQQSFTKCQKGNKVQWEISTKITPNSQLPTPNSQLPTPNSQLPTPNSQLPTPNSQLPTPNSQLPTPNSSLLTPHSQLEPGYAGGNILNLLCHLQTDLTNYDFSCLTIWQAYLQDTPLKKVNFAYADLSKSVFAKTFTTVISTTFSPDGKTLASAHFNGYFRLWDVTSGQELLDCQAHVGMVWCVTFSPDGNTLATAGQDEIIKLWDVTTGQCLKTLQDSNGGVVCARFTQDGNRLITSSTDSSIKIWDISLEQCTKVLLGHHSRVWSVALSLQNDILASAGEDNTIKLWDLATNSCINTLQGHSDWLKSIAFNSSGVLASGSLDKTIRLWNIEQGVCVGVLAGHLNGILAIAFVSDTILASCSIDCTIRLWDITTQQCLKTLQGHSNSIDAIAANPQGTLLATGGDDFSLRLWDVVSGECLRTFKGRNNWIKSVVCSPILPNSLAQSGIDGIIVSGNEDRSVRLWTPDGECRILHGHTDIIFDVDLSRDGRIVASASADTTIRLWDVATGQCIKILNGHQGTVTGVAFSPDGRLLASSSYDSTIKLWDRFTGQLLDTFPVHLGMSIAFSPDGRKLVSGGFDNTVRIWDIITRQCHQTFTGHNNWAWWVALSPDGNKLATASSIEGLIRLWDIETGKCLHILPGHQDMVWAIAFSPDSSILASSSSDGTIKLWDVAQGCCIATLEGHNHWIMSVTFSPEGKHLIAGDGYAAIKIWHLETKSCLTTLKAEQIYEDMNIYGVTGLTEAQKSNLLSLGAVAAWE